MGNCTNCIHKNLQFSDLSPIHNGMNKVTTVESSVTGDMYVECKKGNQKEIVSFYEKNSLLPTKEINDELPCFEQSKLGKSLDQLQGSLDGMIRLMKDVKNA